MLSGMIVKKRIRREHLTLALSLLEEACSDIRGVLTPPQANGKVGAPPPADHHEKE
jgi:hypothetical protein